MDGFPRRGSSIAVAIEGFFAAAWFSWAASDPPSWMPVPLLVASIVSLVIAIVGVLLAIRSGPDPGGRNAGMGSRGYRIIVAVEVVAMVAGAAAFGATNHPDYIAAWISLVVGVHFFPLARVFGRGSMVVVGALICVVAVVAFVVGAASDVGPETVAGAGTGLVLLVSALLLLQVIRSRSGQPGSVRP